MGVFFGPNAAGFSLLHWASTQVREEQSASSQSEAVIGWTFIDVLVGQNAAAFNFLPTPAACFSV